MKLKKITTLVLFLSFFLFAHAQLVHANVADLNLPKTIINPGSFYYPLKRLIEKGRERLFFSREGKISYLESLLKSRLSELDYVTGKKILSEVQGSSERFSFTAGILTEDMVAQNKADKKLNLIKKFELYSRFLDSLRDRFPANSSFWMLVQHDINTLSILSAKLK